MGSNEIVGRGLVFRYNTSDFPFQVINVSHILTHCRFTARKSCLAYHEKLIVGRLSQYRVASTALYINIEEKIGCSPQWKQLG